MTDQMAIAAILGLKTAGHFVPQDCAVIGFDDNSADVQFIDPPLTTVYNLYMRQDGQALCL